MNGQNVVLHIPVLFFTIIDESGFHLTLPSTSRSSSPNLRLMFSSDGSYIAALSSIYQISRTVTNEFLLDEYPSVIYIISVLDFAASAILYQTSPVKGMCWHDQTTLLTVVCEGTSNIYVWQPTGCLSIPQPAVDGARHVTWAPSCDTLLISGPSSFCLAVPDWACY